jgi:hypothetical protein
MDQTTLEEYDEQVGFTTAGLRDIVAAGFREKGFGAIISLQHHAWFIMQEPEFQDYLTTRGATETLRDFNNAFAAALADNWSEPKGPVHYQLMASWIAIARDISISDIDPGIQTRFQEKINRRFVVENAPREVPVRNLVSLVHGTLSPREGSQPRTLTFPEDPASGSLLIYKGNEAYTVAQHYAVKRKAGIWPAFSSAVRELLGTLKVDDRLKNPVREQLAYFDGRYDADRAAYLAKAPVRASPGTPPKPGGGTPPPAPGS